MVSPSRCPPWQPERPGPTRREPRRAQRSYTTPRDTIAPADHATRSKWLERLFEAVQNDGVEYLRPAEERWGEIAHYPDLINKYADRLIEMVRRAWSDHQSFQYVTGTSICLSTMAGNAPGFRSSEFRLTAKQALFSVGWPSYAMKRLLRRGGWLCNQSPANSSPRLIPCRAYPSDPGLTTCWVCGCHRQDVRPRFATASSRPSITLSARSFSILPTRRRRTRSSQRRCRNSFPG